MKIKRMTINKVLTATVLAALFSATWGTLPVSAEEAAGGAASLQTPAETALSETSGSASPQPGTPASAEQPSAEETNTIDHSAESKPIRNIFLKEGEGRPGTEIPYYNERDLTHREWNEVAKIEKEIRILQRERDKFLKDRAREKEDKEKEFAKAFQGRQKYSIVFDPEDYTKKTMDANGEKVSFRAYEHLVYAEKPYEAEHQMLSVYIPEGYFNGETINGFTADTAPIFMPNGVGGYMPGTIVEPQEDSRHGGANSALYALSNGYVVVSPAIRGRSLNSNGYDTGKAPALIVDYKAAVRFVRHNRNKGRIPAGDTEKIIASGTSAGGALAALLGATGNAKEYEPYLKEQGAAKERDDIFAAMAYCPITNLENADMAYEWMFHDASRYYNVRQAPAKKGPGEVQETASEKLLKSRPHNAPAEGVEGIAISPEEKEISAEMRENFSEYLNSLNLRDSLGNKLTLTPDGNGLFREYIESLYLESAQDAIDSGESLKKIPWLTISHGQAVHMDFSKYIKAVKRLKGIPAFDAFDMSSAENNEFGSFDVPNRHFTRYAMEHSKFVTIPTLEEEKELNKEKAAAYRIATPLEKRHLQKYNLIEQMEKDKLKWSQYMADWQTVRMMNPMRFIGLEGISTAPNWRIRHGALDRDTALAIPAMLALKLKNSGKSVDFKVPWGYGHDGDYDLPDLFAWTDRIAKLKDKTDAILKEEALKKAALKEGASEEQTSREESSKVEKTVPIDEASDTSNKAEASAL